MPSTLPARLRRALPRVRLTRRRIITSGVVLAVLAAVVAWATWPKPVNHRTVDFMITVASGPDGTDPITLDSTLYLPKSASAGHKVPAILLAHGFGGTKQDVASDAADYADRGYAVLTWTAQGFGRSTGQIHLDSPDWEVKDAQRLVDWLAARPEVATQAPGDPRVAAVGGSYGGGLSLLLAAYDHRVDAIVPMITWNDLSRSFLPEATGKPAADGVFKKQWAGLFFGAGGSAGPGAGPGAGAGVGAGAIGGAGARIDPQCGRFARDVCQAYLGIAATGRADAEAVALLQRSSPASVIGRIKAPSLLIQGTADSLFPLSEADANARGIAANGTPVRVAWFTGGHDGGAGPTSDTDRLRALTNQWLDHYLRGTGRTPPTSFTYSRVTGLNVNDQGVVTSAYTASGYPGLSGDPSTVDVAGPPQRIANPPAGTPGAISSLPGAGGGLASFVNGAVTEVPGQHADFVSAPLARTVDVVGTPTVRIRAASPTGEAVLFVKLYDLDPRGASTLPDGLAAPVRLTGLPVDLEDASPVTVTLPGIAYQFAAGHRLRLTVSSSDQAYATPVEPTVYTVSIDSAYPAVSLPAVAAKPIGNPDVVWRYVLVGLLAAIAAGLAVALAVAHRRRRRTNRTVLPEYADTPLVVRGLRKEYGDGFVAVSSVDFTVERGQVVGLLGPNGAGKTTALRVLMGLISPTAGEVLLFGHALAPGAPVLSRVGALVEGPGFLPHLSGLANLRLYWRSTGRPQSEAYLDEALEIAGLGSAIHRKVKTYSHGMRQRLAIAQAMLGLPELLVLDEPTDGLDPPQIAQMRAVLRRYATAGRSVLVSSHLLAEVEQTCTDVVVMDRGLVVAAGGVDEIVGDSPTVQLEVSDVDGAETVLEKLDAVRSVAWSGGGGLVVDIDGAPRSEIVAALVRAGVGVDRVVPRRRLEDAFLALVGGGGDRDSGGDSGGGGGGNGGGDSGNDASGER